MSDEVADLLDAAADAIEKYGHTKYVGGNKDVGFCTIGAVTAVACEPVFSRDSHPCSRILRHQALDTVATVAGLTSFVSIPRWNDEDERTQQDVLDVLRKAAKEERS